MLSLKSICKDLVTDSIELLHTTNAMLRRHRCSKGGPPTPATQEEIHEYSGELVKAPLFGFRHVTLL